VHFGAKGPVSLPFVFFFFWWEWFELRACVLAKQVLYNLSHTSNPFCFVILEMGVF
jgi:hypothetical protein